MTFSEPLLAENRSPLGREKKGLHLFIGHVKLNDGLNRRFNGYLAERLMVVLNLPIWPRSSNFELF